MNEKELSIPNLSREEILEKFNGSRIARRQYFSHIKEPILTIRPNAIQFSQAAVSQIDTMYIYFRVFKEDGLVFVEAAEEDDIDSQMWARMKDEKKQSRQITGWPFATYLYKLMGWNKGYYYKAYGSMALKEAEGDRDVLCFELKTADKFFLTKKAREDLHISMEDLGNEWGVILEEDKRREEEQAQRERDKAAGRKPAPRKISVMQSDKLEEGEIGPLGAEHRSHIRIPRTSDGKVDTTELLMPNELLAEVQDGESL